MKYIVPVLLILSIISCKKQHITNDLCDCSDTPWSYTVDTVNIIVPNIITPNADGRNDVWFIENLSQFEHKLTVKRPGILGGTLLETNNYMNDWDGDGIKDGKYKYIIEVEGQIFEGYLCIVKDFLDEYRTCTYGLYTIDEGDPLIIN